MAQSEEKYIKDLKNITNRNQVIFRQWEFFIFTLKSMKPIFLIKLGKPKRNQNIQRGPAVVNIHRKQNN